MLNSASGSMAESVFFIRSSIWAMSAFCIGLTSGRPNMVRASSGVHSTSIWIFIVWSTLPVVPTPPRRSHGGRGIGGLVRRAADANLSQRAARRNGRAAGKGPRGRRDLHSPEEYRDEQALAGNQPLPAPAQGQSRSTGGRGAKRRWPRPSARTSRSCSRSATPPATGATSWPTRASRTTRSPR